MQTIQINVADNKIDVIMNLLNNLKDEVIENYKIINTENNEDKYFQQRKARLHKLREDIRSGKEPLRDFESSIDELLVQL